MTMSATIILLLDILQLFEEVISYKQNETILK